MRARAYLDAGGRADRAAIAEALDANLCRCGAHPRILDAVMDAARRMGTAT
jgi:nicotinate dehydrogenase subunit A